MTSTGPFVVMLSELDRSRAAAVGAKGANLGELTRIDGVSVPPGFCVTTAAYRRAVAAAPPPGEIERLTVPDEVARAVGAALAELGASTACAVRSSATAEDLPTASFAGQHDTYLQVVGLSEILGHIARCWASLSTERAMAYRRRNGIDHHRVEMAVVVQQMVDPETSGVLFTADPVTGNRRTATVEGTPGLGDALVSGTVEPDRYVVREGRLVDRTVRRQPVLTEQQVLELEALGRRIEARFGSPQDIEWCLDDRGFHIVQTRPITTLFPVPEADDDANHVYVSVGHPQMMTEPMTPLGLSVWQLTSPAPMRIAGSRLFVDVTARLSSPALRAATLELFGRSDPLLRDALDTVLARDFVPAATDSGPPPVAVSEGPAEPIAADPAIVAELIERHRASIAELRREMRTASGSGLFARIVDDLAVWRGLTFDPRHHQAVMAGFEAAWWLDDHLREWLGEENASAPLSLAAPGNVTAEMGLALLDVADAIRPHPEVVAFLRAARDDDFLDGLDALEGGPEARDAIVAYLDRYGMRCVGEIDIGRPRWSERPSALLPMLLSNVEHFEPGEHRRRIEHGEQQAARAEAELLNRLRELPEGAEKAAETEQTIRRLRTFIGFREYPKYALVSRYLVHKQALVAEAERLVAGGVLDAVDDMLFLTFDELHDAVRTGRADRDLIAQRRVAFRADASLTPPRVLTSDGDALHGAYRRDDVPAGALAGLGVSNGTVEGRARVVDEMADADLEPGDILVTTHTDPSWSPAFVTIGGLVTEVGGLMTHGAVIAREYGLPTVVGVEHATRLIPDGRRIRVDGARGYVELLPEPP